MLRWFWDLNEGRQSHHDLSPHVSANRELIWRTSKRIDRFSHSEIMAWQALNGISLEPWQLAAISLIDEAYVKAFNSADTPKSTLVPVKRLTSRLFDAMFRK